jgi:hypothetical protein
MEIATLNGNPEWFVVTRRPIGQVRQPCANLEDALDLAIKHLSSPNNQTEAVEGPDGFRLDRDAILAMRRRRRC